VHALPGREQSLCERISNLACTEQDVQFECHHQRSYRVTQPILVAFGLFETVNYWKRPRPVITYRRLLPIDDVGAITSLLHEAYAPLAAAGMKFVASHQNAEMTRQRVDKGETFVATDGDLIVGIITLAEVHATHGSPFYDRADVADFGQFAVRPAYQRRGIGSRLIEMVESRAREKGVAELALNTSEHATALISMYSSKGYRFVEYVQWDDVNYRSMIFSKTLK
jgi:GNAT superfamily N-acetyltransferase